METDDNVVNLSAYNGNPKSWSPQQMLEYVLGAEDIDRTKRAIVILDVVDEEGEGGYYRVLVSGCANVLEAVGLCALGARYVSHNHTT